RLQPRGTAGFHPDRRPPLRRRDRAAPRARLRARHRLASPPSRSRALEAVIETYRAVVDKRDQRVYLPKPIPPDALRKILQAGRMTGSSKNREPTRLIVVTERESVRALGALREGGKSLAQAAVAIVTAQVEPHVLRAARRA